MLKDHSDRLSIGDAAPQFRLSTADDQRIALEDFRGKTLLVVFMRGTWWPNCQKQLAQFESAADEFTHRKVNVVFIAAQKIDGITGGRKFIEKRGYRFPILFDAQRETTRAFGVYHLVGIDAFRIAYPAAFLIDPSGKILWIAVSRSQTELPTIDEFLGAIDK